MLQSTELQPPLPVAPTHGDRAYSHILSQLLRRELRPGDVVDRRQIADDLQISLIPVADAIQRLTYEGFLATRRRQGTFVRSPGREDVRGQLLLREALECQAARLYCGAIIEAQFVRLEPLALDADAAADAGGDLSSRDFAFHQALLELTGCQALIDCFQRVIQLSMFHQTALLSPMQVATYDRHISLLKDLCQLSPDAAEARIRRHVRSGKEPFFGDTP